MNSLMQQKEHDYLDVFQQVTRLISTVHDPQEVMDLVVRKLPELLEVDAVTIRLFDIGTGTFVLGAASGVSDEYLSRTTIDSKEVLAELLKGRPTARTDMDTHCDHEDCNLVNQEGIKGIMSLPILHKGEVIGMLRLLAKQARDFVEQEMNFAMSLAEQVGMAIVNSRLFQQLEYQVDYLSELRKMSRLVNSTLDLDSILQSTVTALPTALSVKGCTIRLLDPSTNRLELLASSGLSEKYLQRGSIHEEESIRTVMQGEPVSIYDAGNDPRLSYHEAIRAEGIKSILLVPIKDANEVIGVIRLLTDSHHVFSPAEINFALSMAKESGNAISKARTYRKITLLFNQIEEHERFLQTILDSLWLQVVVVDRDKRIIMANKVFQETRGYRETQILGQLYHRISPWRQDDDRECPVNKTLREGRSMTVLDFLPTPSTTSSDMQLEKKRGTSSRWYERYLSPIVNQDNQVDFIIEAVRDITDQKMLEQEKLERVKLEGVVEMAGTAAHELNTPLFAALGTAQLLRDDLSDMVPSPGQDQHHSQEMVEEMDMIIRNLQRMGKLTRKMTAVTGFEGEEYVGKTRIVKLTGQGTPLPQRPDK